MIAWRCYKSMGLYWATPSWSESETKYIFAGGLREGARGQDGGASGMADGSDLQVQRSLLLDFSPSQIERSIHSYECLDAPLDESGGYHPDVDTLHCPEVAQPQDTQADRATHCRELRNMQ